jgi:hypothetical protein
VVNLLSLARNAPRSQRFELHDCSEHRPTQLIAGVLATLRCRRVFGMMFQEERRRAGVGRSQTSYKVEGLR